MLDLENPEHSIVLFHLLFCRHRHLFCEKYRFFPKKPRGAPVHWGEVMVGVRQPQVTAEMRCGKEICVHFQDPPRNAEGEGLEWDGNLGWKIGELV